MKKKFYSLSICITSFNRREELNELLSSIYEFSKDYLEFIEVCISDNASEDDIQGLIQLWEVKFKSLSFFRHDKNKGFQKNLIYSISMAKNDFIWLFSNDDNINTDFTFLMLQQELNYQCDMYIFNRNICSEEHVVLSEDVVVNSNAIFDWKINFDDYCNYSRSVDAFGCFVSGIILKHKVVKNIVKLSENDIYYLNNIFPHVYLIFLVLKDIKQFRVKSISNFAVDFRSNNSCFIKDRIGLLRLQQYEDLVFISYLIKKKKFKEKFLKIVGKQFKKAVIDNLNFLDDNKSIFLIHQPLAKLTVEELEKKQMWERLNLFISKVDVLTNDKKIILFGFGLVGKLIYRLIKDRVFLIVDNNLDFEFYENVPIIKAIDLDNYYTDNSFIIVTLYPFRYPNILKNLQKYKNIIGLDL